MDLEDFAKHANATTPAKIPHLRKEERHKFLQYFSEARENFLPHDKRYAVATDRIDRLTSAIEHNRLLRLGWWTAGLAGFGIVATVLSNLQCLSNKQIPTRLRETASIAPATNPKVPMMPLAPTPTPTVAPTATATPESMPTAQPSQSPLLSPSP